MTKEEYTAWLADFMGDIPDDEEIAEGRGEIESVRAHNPKLAGKLEGLLAATIEIVKYTQAQKGN